MPLHGRWFCMALLPLLLTILPASSPSGLDRRPSHDTREGVEVSGALRVIAFRTASVDPAVAQSFTALRNAVIRRETERTGHVKPDIPVAEAVPEQVVVQMRAPKCDDGALSAALTGSKSRVLSHVSTCSFVVLCESVGAVLSLEAHPDIGWVGPMLPEYKTAPELAARAPAGAAGSRRREAAEAAAANATRVWLEVMLAATPDAALRGRWEAALSRAVAPGVASVTRDSARAAVVECAAADLAPVARWLAQQWEVLWLEERAEARRLNFHVLYNSGAPGELAANASGLAARGIDGRGEVAGVADSGLDVDHCFFRDDARGVRYDGVDPEHRKVARANRTRTVPASLSRARAPPAPPAAAPRAHTCPALQGGGLLCGDGAVPARRHARRPRRRARGARLARRRHASPTPHPPPGTKRTRRVPSPKLSRHASHVAGTLAGSVAGRAGGSAPRAPRPAPRARGRRGAGGAAVCGCGACAADRGARGGQRPHTGVRGRGARGDARGGGR
jgi:hypothetical protein